VIPENKEEVWHLVERLQFSGMLGFGPSLNDSVETRSIDRLPRVCGLYIGAVDEIRALLSS
jgi:hypothetical protein